MVITGVLDLNSLDDTVNNIGHIFTSKGIKYAVIDPAIIKAEVSFCVERYLKELDEAGVQIIIIKMDAIDTISHDYLKIGYDVLIIGANEEIERFTELEKENTLKLALALKKEGIIIINSDFSLMLDVLSGLNCNFITYGFNPKASVTTSSIGDFITEDFFLCSVQRSIATISGNVLLPQEIKILNSETLDHKIYSQLSAITLAFVVDINFD